MRRRHLSWLTLPLVAATFMTAPGNAALRPQVLDVLRPGFQGEDSLAPKDLDTRTGVVLPSPAQRAAVRALGAKVTWNRFGSPKSLYNSKDLYLAPPKQGDAVDVARAWARDNATLLRLTPELTTPENLELVANNPLYDSPDYRRMRFGLKPKAKDSTLPHVVLFRQVFDGVDAANEGLLIVLLNRQNRVVHVAASVTGDTKVTNTATVRPAAAWQAAAADIGWRVPLSDIQDIGKSTVADYTGLKVAGQPETQLARLVALPTPRDGVRLAYEVNVMDNTKVGHAEPVGYVSFVDAQTGKVLVRQSAIDYFSDMSRLPMQAPVPDPRWKVFPNTPTWPVQGEASPDTRKMWCWYAGDGCDLIVDSGHETRERPQVASPYDVIPQTGLPSLTSEGNDSYTSASYASHAGPDAAARTSMPSPTRNYTYTFTDQWHTSNCNLSRNYGTPQQNDIDAAINNLFFNYGRMHDWSYFLGFYENTWNMQEVNYGGEDTPQSSEDAQGGDPEVGQAQAGSVAGSVLFTGRDNANQRTMADGIPPITNQYLWHPLQAGFYSPCVDGAYDMGIVAHEYTHAISNRMIGGPAGSIQGNEGGSMGESWSDLAAMEYNNSHNFAPVGDENPYAVGPYATGSKQRGIRNYGMNDSPLDYSNLGYDGNGATSPHADGEIWSATNFQVRKALIEKYQAQFPYEDKALQWDCANGIKPADECPGNRRWIQLMFDAFLIQDAAAGMPQAAAAQLMADVARFDGANQKEMRHAFASRGMGVDSDEAGFADWSSDKEENANVSFRVVPVGGGGVPVETYVHVGQYTARTAEAAIAKRASPTAPRKFVEGTYEFTARADGYGMYRFKQTFKAGDDYVVEIPMRKNLASTYHEAEATGDGGNFEQLIDDTEETNWAFLGEDETVDIEGKQVTVDLTGGRQLVREIQVSAINRPQETSNPYDTLAQNRFASLRSFEILGCDETKGADCEEEDGYKVMWTSPDDAFPSGRPRPISPNLKLKNFDVPDFYATHVRLRVLTNQCTGNPIYSLEQNPVGEPLSDPDCVNGFTAATLADTNVDPTDPPPLANNTQKHRVRISELQVFSEVTPGRRQTQPGGDNQNNDDDDKDDDKGGDTPNRPNRPRAQQPTTPNTGASPVLPIVATMMAAGSALVLRRRRTA